MSAKRLFLSLLVSFSLLSGCSTIGGVFSDPTAKAVTQVAFDLAVSHAISEENVDAQKIVDHMDALQSLLDGDAEASVSLLADALLERIDFKDMEPDQAASVRALVIILSARAEDEIERRGSVPEETKVILSEVIQWIRQSAALRASV